MTYKPLDEGGKVAIDGVGPIVNCLIRGQFRKPLSLMVTNVFVGLFEGRSLLNETEEVDRH